MGRYDFVSPGAAGGNAIQTFLIQRALQQHQAQMDALAQQRVQDEEKQKAADLELRTGQERRIAEMQKATLADAEDQRQFSRTSTIAENALPGDVADPETVARFQKYGFGSQIKKVPGVVSQGAFQGNDANEIPQYDVNQSPDTFQMRGGSKYLSARAAADEREAAAKEAQAAREAAAQQQRDFQASQGEANRDLRRDLAAGQSAGAAETRGLRNQLLEQQVAAGAQKATDAKTAVANSRGELRDLAQSLLDDPALDAISGTIGAHTPDVTYASREAANRLNQLKSKLTLEQRSKLKGQGGVSDFEGKMVERGATALDRAAGAANVRKHLQEIVDALQGDAPRAELGTTNTQKTSGGPAIGETRTINGQAAHWDGHGWLPGAR